MTAWELAGRMSDDCLERLLDDLREVPLVDENLVEAYADGRWLYEPSCSACGFPVDSRRRGCVTCMNRHEKRRQRGAEAAPPFPKYDFRDRQGRFVVAA